MYIAKVDQAKCKVSFVRWLGCESENPIDRETSLNTHTQGEPGQVKTLLLYGKAMLLLVHGFALYSMLRHRPNANLCTDCFEILKHCCLHCRILYR